MKLPNIDYIANPATDNWLTQDICRQLYISIEYIAFLDQDDFNKIKSITLNAKEIKEIPKEIGNLFNLESLTLVKNEISKLPKEFGNLANLLYLDLSSNQLTKLSEEIGSLTNLNYLNLN